MHNWYIWIYLVQVWDSNYLTLSELCKTFATIKPTAVNAAKLNPAFHHVLVSVGSIPNSLKFLRKTN